MEPTVVRTARWCEEEGGWQLEVVERNQEAQGFRYAGAVDSGANFFVVDT